MNFPCFWVSYGVSIIHVPQFRTGIFMALSQLGRQHGNGDGLCVVFWSRHHGQLFPLCEPFNSETVIVFVLAYIWNCSELGWNYGYAAQLVGGHNMPRHRAAGDVLLDERPSNQVPDLARKDLLESATPANRRSFIHTIINYHRSDGVSYKNLVSQAINAITTLMRLG